MDTLNSQLEEQGLLIEKEAQEIMRAEVEKALENGWPLQYVHSNSHLGDHFIIRSALTLVLTKYANENGKNQPIISLSHTQQENSIDLISLANTWGFNSKVYEDSLNHLHKGIMVWIAQQIGVSLTSEELNSTPLPYPCDYEGSPMRNFSWEKVNKYVEILKSQFGPHDKYCVILHGGSNPLKRFTADQVKAIRTTIKTLFPSNKIAILTAQSVDGSNGLEPQDADFFVDAVQDINLTTALFLALPEITYITTDTFLAWLGAGTISLRPDRNKQINPKDVYVMYTLASPRFWGIPHARHFASAVVNNFVKKERLISANDNIMYPQDYIDYWIALGVSEEGASKIADLDLASFLQFITFDNAML